MSTSKHVHKHDAMPVAKFLTGGTRGREFDGVIVTAREQTTDERVVFHRSGRPKESLAAACADVDDLDGDWRIISISTPQTIYRDLQGTRAGVWMDKVEVPERRLLGAVGRRDLLDPSLYKKEKRDREASTWP